MNDESPEETAKDRLYGLVDLIATRAAETAIAVAAVSRKLDIVIADVEILKSDVGTLKSESGELRREMLPGFARLEAQSDRIDRLETRVERLERGRPPV